MEERGQRGKELIHQTHQPLISRRTKGHPCKAASSASADPRPRVVSARCETLSHPRPEGPSQALLSPLRCLLSFFSALLRFRPSPTLFLFNKFCTLKTRYYLNNFTRGSPEPEPEVRRLLPFLLT